MKQDKTLFIINEIFRKVIITMYIPHSILYWVNYNSIHFYEFATNRNPTCGTDEEVFQLGQS